jgi:hypothetical protein
VEGHLRTLVLRKSDWSIGILALLEIDFGKDLTKSQNIWKDPTVTSADLLSRCLSREIDLGTAVSHPSKRGIEGPSGSSVVTPEYCTRW